MIFNEATIIIVQDSLIEEKKYGIEKRNETKHHRTIMIMMSRMYRKERP